jgi:hypothetical protein
MAKAEKAVSDAFDKTKVKKIADVVVPSLSIQGVKTGDTKYFRYESELSSKPQLEEKGVNKGKQKVNEDGEPCFIHTLIAVDLESGERGELVVGAIIHGKQSVDPVPLAGRSFAWTKGAATSGKATKWEVIEIAY